MKVLKNYMKDSKKTVFTKVIFDIKFDFEDR